MHILVIYLHHVTFNLQSNNLSKGRLSGRTKRMWGAVSMDTQTSTSSVGHNLVVWAHN